MKTPTGRRRRLSPPAGLAALVPWPARAESALAVPDPAWRLQRPTDHAAYLDPAELQAVAGADFLWRAPSRGAPITAGHLDRLAARFGLDRDAYYRLAKHAAVQQVVQGLAVGKWSDTAAFALGHSGAEAGPGRSWCPPGEGGLMVAGVFLEDVLAPMLPLVSGGTAPTERGCLWNLRAAVAEGLLELVTRFDWQGERRASRLLYLKSVLVASTIAAHELRGAGEEHPEARDAAARLARAAAMYLDAAWAELTRGGHGDLRQDLLAIADHLRDMPIARATAPVLNAAAALERP